MMSLFDSRKNANWFSVMDWPLSQTPQRQMCDDSVRMVNDKHKFVMQIDVRQYKPEEINVSVHNEASVPFISMKGCHEERVDSYGGHVSRQFSRRYTLPADVDVKNVQCALSNCGVLTVQVAKQAQILDNTGARHIPITMVDKPAKLCQNGETTEKEVENK